MIKLNFKQGSKKGGKDIALLTIADKKESLAWMQGNPKLIIGIDEAKKMNRNKLILLGRKMIRVAQANKIKKIALSFNDFKFKNIDISETELAEVLAISWEMANFNFTKYKSKSEKSVTHVKEIHVYGKIDVNIKSAFKKGQIIAGEVNASRVLANTPGGDMTPEILAQKAKEAVIGTDIKVKVLQTKEMEKLGMGALLGVAKGSVFPPRFIIMEYMNGEKDEKPVVLVGKGVTFDTGGLNLKPDTSILEMHMDMSGGSAMIHAIVAMAKLGIKQNIVALIPAVENMLGGESYRPGDILKSMSGKTIEVLNTDAEGRLILVDALHYARQYKPRLVVDTATLTGASVVALGERMSALFSNNEEIAQKFKQAGDKVGDYAWILPLAEEYEAELEGTFADLANITKKRWGGAITASVFLHQFIKDIDWVHIDMAPRMVALDDEYLAKGSVGAPILMILKALE